MNVAQHFFFYFSPKHIYKIDDETKTLNTLNTGNQIDENDEMMMADLLFQKKNNFYILKRNDVLHQISVSQSVTVNCVLEFKSKKRENENFKFKCNQR